jgi:hypothetical protein
MIGGVQVPARIEVSFRERGSGRALDPKHLILTSTFVRVRKIKVQLCTPPFHLFYAL